MSFFNFSAKMAVSDVSQKYDFILRIFKISKHQNILALTVWPIVPITLLFPQNRQFGRFTAKISNMLNLHFDPFWSNVTYSPDTPVNVLIESRNIRKIGTVSSYRICTKLLLSTSHRLTAEYKWHHTTSL